MMRDPERFVVYNEFVSDEKRAELFRRASVVVLPYVEATQSGVIPIAYALERPVIATTVGGLPELVEHGRTGFLVEPRDERALARRIVELLQNRRLARSMGLAGRKKLELESSADVTAEKTLAVYRKATEDRRGGVRP
jgi:glycosyltransferase involved in cell wall biosynthesis